MTVQSAEPGQVIDLLGSSTDVKTKTLVKTKTVEIIKLNLAEGKSLAEHKAPGLIIVQILEGHIRFFESGNTHDMTPGQLLYLEAGHPHSLHAAKASSFLLTIVRS